MIITKDNYFFYSPGEIRYERYQTIWLIACVLRLPEGEWPLEPGNVGESQHSKPSHAPYEGACDVMAELRKRLELVPEDAREALIDQVQGYYDEFNRLIHYEFLTSPAQRVLNYLSVKRRRKQTYPQWKYDKKRRPNGKPNI